MLAATIQAGLVLASHVRSEKLWVKAVSIAGLALIIVTLALNLPDFDSSSWYASQINAT